MEAWGNSNDDGQPPWGSSSPLTLGLGGASASSSPRQQSDHETAEDRGDSNDDEWRSWGRSSPANSGLGSAVASPEPRQQSNAETQSPQSASRLGPTNASPFAWCTRCVKRIGKEGHKSCNRSSSYEKCRYCQELGKLCVPVPIPLRGDVTNLLLLGPDRQLAAVAAFARKADAYREAIGDSTDKQKLIVMQSLNRNMFRLVNAVCAASGQPVFPDKDEEVWPEVHGGVVDRKEEEQVFLEVHGGMVDGKEEW